MSAVADEVKTVKKMIYELGTCAICMIMGFVMGVGYFMGRIDKCVDRSCGTDPFDVSCCGKCSCDKCKCSHCKFKQSGDASND